MLRTYGVLGLKAYIRNHIRLGETFHGLVRSRPDLFEVLTPPAFALTVLTIKPANEPGNEEPDYVASHLRLEERKARTKHMVEYGKRQLERANKITKKVYELINAGGEIFLTSSIIKGVYAIRVVSANPKANEEHLREAFNILVRTAEDVIGNNDQASSTTHVNGTASI